MERNMKKSRYIRNVIDLLLRITIICFILLLLYAAWPSIHPGSFQLFTDWIKHLSQGYVYTVLVPMCIKHGLQNTPVIAVAEIALIAFILWKAIFRGGIIAFFKIKTLIMFAISFAWIWYVLYYGIRIHQTAFWGVYSFIYSNMLLISHAIFLPFVTLNGIDYVMLMIPVIIIYFLLYIVVLVNFAIASHKNKLFRLNHRRIKSYGLLDLEEVLNRVGVLHKLFFARPKLYIDGTREGYMNAYCLGRRIAIGIGFLFDTDKLGTGDIAKLMTSALTGDERIEIMRQGVLGHELGHYYHHDTAATMLCEICMASITLPLQILMFVSYIASFIPVLGIMAKLYNVLFQLIWIVTAVPMGLLDSLLYFIDGKWSERNADRFSVDLGYGFGCYMFLLYASLDDDYKPSILKRLRQFLKDIHPSDMSRMKYIRKRIINTWGEEYWKALEEKYLPPQYWDWVF